MSMSRSSLIHTLTSPSAGDIMRLLSQVCSCTPAQTHRLLGSTLSCGQLGDVLGPVSGWRVSALAASMRMFLMSVSSEKVAVGHHLCT